MLRGVEVNKKKMGGLGKLSQFSGIRHSSVEVKSQESEVSSQEQETNPPPIQNPKSKIQNQEKLVTVNIKVTKSQRDWLADTASQVRDNNTQPVPSKERVYPQHLIGVAIELLQEAEVDWEQVKGIEDLREQLNL